MGFFEPSFITLALAYEAFVYIAAQIINAARMRWEDLRLRPDQTKFAAVAANRALFDFHVSYAVFLLINGWIVFFCMASFCVLVAQIRFHFEHELLPKSPAIPLLWDSVLLVLSLLTNRAMRQHYSSESKQLGVKSPVASTWPMMRIMDQADRTS